jgi:hypothetical protein
VLDGAKRYYGGTVPKKPLGYFSEKGAVQSFDTYPEPLPVSAGDCTGCPTRGGSVTPGAPSTDAFVIEYFDASEEESGAGS